jgi:hypothetical protein
MAAALPTRNPALLAAALREQGLPGQRSKTAITRLRRERAKQRPIEPRYHPGVRARANARVAGRYAKEISRRGGETTIDSRDRFVPLTVADRPTWGKNVGLVLLHAEGWRAYSRAFGHRRASLSYLCGTEDGQPWAVRVPGTIETVRSALAWITPAEVIQALDAGRRAERQGDVYAIETTRPHDGKGELPESHVWDAGRRVLSHPQHGNLCPPYPVRFVTQNAYQMGRSSRRGPYGD